MADKEKGSEYVVLWRDGVDEWTELGVVTASSEAQAKNKALALWKPAGGWVVAAPARSWKPENKQPQIRFV